MSIHHSADLLGRVLADPGRRPYALLYRPHEDEHAVDVLIGQASELSAMSELPEPSEQGPSTVLAMIPFRQITERGYACNDDNEPLISIEVTERAKTSLEEVLQRLPDIPLTLSDGGFDIDDSAYADIVRSVLTQEIAAGEGANFVVHRTYSATVDNYSLAAALALFRALLTVESGSFWTFLVSTGDRTFVGATPERHITVRDGVAVMNPISGTYRYPTGGAPVLDDVMAFLADQKESDELYMVLDEELKMMAQICDGGGKVVGPRLREMSRLAHTEYFIEGRTRRQPREILRETLFAPTVTGSPLENACRVISRHEPAGRAFYSGVAALIDVDGTLDSAILIRSADIDASGHLRIGVGATLVRDSDPDSEVAETKAKVAGLLSAFGPQGRIADHPDVLAALTARNASISRFWLAHPDERQRSIPAYRPGGRALVLDAEDSFTWMIRHQLTELGLDLTVRPFEDRIDDFADFDVVILGPGPGDPGNVDDPKIARIGRAVSALLATGTPFLAVCLSHQVTCAALGLPLRRRTEPNQGTQRMIELFGERQRVGFYNSYEAFTTKSHLDHPVAGRVDICSDRDAHEVHALRAPSFVTIQFHAESVMTESGPRIFADLLGSITQNTGPAECTVAS
ncbi:anthranilate synthase family protein [Nocardia noduli]|uniref:anthranilate synthase family protein n=1 Tax=Nocardia noduli TaxID=2815722 RepID=UPI001C24BB91|nr:chorismate-binding protein [Nocardia noduli]